MSAPVNFVLSERALADGSALITLEGDTSPAAARAVAQRLADAADRGTQLVLVDMSGVSFVDSTVVRALGIGADAARRSGMRVVVLEPIDPNVARPLSLGRLDAIAEVVGTLDEAAERTGVAPETVQPPSGRPEPASLPSAHSRRTMFGRRTRDKEILQELGQLRRMVQELSKASGGQSAPAAATDGPAELEAVRVELEEARIDARAARAESDRMEEEAEKAHARIQVLEAELAAARTQLETARAEADRMEEEAERAHARIQALETELAGRSEPREQAPRPVVSEPVRESRPPLPVWADPTPIDLNSAGLDDLMLLPGIGRRPAERILAYRDENGGFRSVEELFEITEIPRDRLTRIQPYVRV